MENGEYTIQFKMADHSHVRQMHDIEEAVFPVPWSLESLSQDVCDHEIAYYIVGICSGEVVSYAGFWHVLDESHVTNLAVKQEFRRMGVGEAMLNILFEAAVKLGVRTMTLEVRESNAAAIGMYEKTGFIKTGRRKRYYSDNNEDALIMTKTL